MDKTSINHQVHLKIRVRFAECDAQNIVFNARYADYADIAATEYMRAIIGSHNTLIEQGYDTRVVNLNIDWFASASFDDILTLSISCERTGNTSFTLKTACTKENLAGDSVLLATIRVTYVVINTSDNSKAAIPEFLRQSFELPLNVTVDQVG